MAPIFYNGVPFGPDQTQHYQSAAAVYNSLAEGNIYPSITGDIDHDFGYYRLRFYPPLTYYVLAISNLLIRDWYFSNLIVLFLCFFMGGVGVYLWTKEGFGELQALIAAAIYTFAPYHLNQLYGSFLLAEFVVMAILPFCFFFLTRICRRTKWIDVIGLTISYALLILTHLPITIIGSITLGLYGLFLIKRENAFSTIGKSALAILSATIMTSFYWARMLPEVSWINHSLPTYFSGEFDYRANFLLVPDHILNYQDDSRSLWFAELMLFSTLIILLPALILLIRKKVKATRFIIAFSWILAFSIFMASPISSFVWKTFDFLQKVQFPWRWLAVISSFSAVLAATGIARVSDSLKATKNVLVPVGLGLVLLIFVFTAAFITKGAVYVSRADLNRQLADVPNSEGCACWWPRWVKKEAFDQKEKILAPGRTVEITKWLPTDKRFNIEAGQPTDAIVAAFYYPRWNVAINGSRIKPVPTADGTISFPIPADTSRIKLTFDEPTYITVANVASIISWLFSVILFGVLRLKLKRNSISKLNMFPLKEKRGAKKRPPEIYLNMTRKPINGSRF